MCVDLPITAEDLLSDHLDQSVQQPVDRYNALIEKGPGHLTGMTNHFLLVNFAHYVPTLQIINDVVKGQRKYNTKRLHCRQIKIEEKLMQKLAAFRGAVRVSTHVRAPINQSINLRVNREGNICNPRSNQAY